MIKRTTLLVFVGAALAGCQGTPIGDAMIGKEKLAEMDDQYCQSIGAKKGTDVYVQCRMVRTSERSANHQRAFARAGAGFEGAGASLRQNAYNNRPVSCTTTPQSTFVGGAPSSYRTSCY
ncbi:MAG: hypothetical protein PGN22_02860 [Agrobacterium cavarae]